MSDIINKIQHVLDPVLTSKGLTLWDIEFRKDGPKWLLRLFIDREVSGVTLDDCESVSRDLSLLLDVEDTIPHAYTLEVSSPGLDRTLSRPEHFRKCMGKLIRVKTFQGVEGQKVFRGVLQDLQGNTVVLRTDNGTDLVLPMENIAKASLEVVLWPGGSVPLKDI